MTLKLDIIDAKNGEFEVKTVKYFLAGWLLWSLWGCAEPDYSQEESAYIVLKTPAVKYADMGFIYENAHEVKAEIYGNGQALMTLKISGGSVCMSRLQCMSQNAFNRAVLSRYYPDDTLEKIFRGEPILDAKNKRTKSNGFTQHIVNQGKYDIEYSVLNNHIQFRDKINQILIKVIRQ